MFLEQPGVGMALNSVGFFASRSGKLVAKLEI